MNKWTFVLSSYNAGCNGLQKHGLVNDYTINCFYCTRVYYLK
jgi:hypothetical protein